MTEQNVAGREAPGPNGDRVETTPDLTGKKQGGGRFKPGQSGNPRGRPLGARNRVTQKVEKLVFGQLESITQGLVDRAKEGNVQAATLLYRTFMGAMRDRSALVALALPKIESAEDAARAIAMTIEAVAEGKIDPDSGQRLVEMISAGIKVREQAEYEQRIAALEAAKQRENNETRPSPTH